MLDEFAVAEYALNRAIDCAFDANMKGPCNCDEYMEQIEKALGALEKARRFIHLWDGKEVKE